MEYYSAAHSGVRQESSTIIYQQNPINMICQQGPNSHISIAKSENIQIGHGNVMSRQTACGEPGKRRVVAEGAELKGDLVLPGESNCFTSLGMALGTAFLRVRPMGHTSPALPLILLLLNENKPFCIRITQLPLSQQDAVKGLLQFSL